MRILTSLFCLIIVNAFFAMSFVPNPVSAIEQHSKQSPYVLFQDSSAGHWVPCTGLPGCISLLVSGNPTTGASESLFKFKAGTRFSPHYHTSPEHVVGISGTMEWQVDGIMHYLGSGDYLYYASKRVHSGRCSPDADCLFYVYDDQPYDIHMAS